MEYRSTRNHDLCVRGAEAVIQGIAPDGGLYVPDRKALNAFDPESVYGRPYEEAAETILSFFFGELPDIGGAVKSAYTGRFETKDPVELVKVGDRYVLELFHGPTKAFKDLALLMLPELILRAKKAEGREEQTLILTATSGDTGKAAMEGFRDVPGTGILVFFPAYGVSNVQEAQMRTQEGCNTASVGVRGNFDDVQTAVKKIFGDLREDADLAARSVRLSSANSINIGRLVPQIVYYFHAYNVLLNEGVIRKGDPVDFTVPTGNFGDILAGFYAQEMGLPVHKLICASNKNQVLTDFFRTGTYDKNRTFYKTESPSMDILVSSNLERLIYLLSGEDSAYIAGLMKSLNTEGVFSVTPEIFAKMQESFGAGTLDDAAGRTVIRETYQQHHYLTDTHTAVALGVYESWKEETGSECPGIVLSTASPYKFPEAVLSALKGETEKAAQDGDGFKAMAELEALTGIPAPEALSGLPKKEVRFKGVIDRDEMEETVRKFSRGETV